MRGSAYLIALAAALCFSGCSEESRYVRTLGPGPSAIPPAPSHPKVEGRVTSVSSADIREVIRLKQQDMLKEYGRVLPIYTIRVHSRNHVEVQFWGAEGTEYWRDAHRVNGKWKFDELVTVRIS